ncbi:MAG: hypothetical protein ACREUF_07460 [Solimonas sp.]
MNGKKAKALRGKCGRDPRETEYVVSKRTPKEITFIDGRKLTFTRICIVLAHGCGRSLYRRLKRESDR